MLKKIDIKAMKLADSITFRNVSGSNTIECNKNADESHPYDQKYTINVDQRNHGKTVSEAFYYLNSCKYDECMQTVIGLLRENDELMLQWIAANNSQLLDEAELYNDELWLVVKRPLKNGDHNKLVFKIGHSICKSNSARMIQK